LSVRLGEKGKKGERIAFELIRDQWLRRRQHGWYWRYEEARNWSRGGFRFRGEVNGAAFKELRCPVKEKGRRKVGRRSRKWEGVDHLRKGARSKDECMPKLHLLELHTGSEGGGREMALADEGCLNPEICSNPRLHAKTSEAVC